MKFYSSYCFIEWPSKFSWGSEILISFRTTYFWNFIKVVENEILYKKVNGRTYLSYSGVELEAFKDWYVSNILLYWNGNVNALPKLPIILKKCSNKSYLEWNFIRRSQWTPMSIFCRSRVGGLQRLIRLKYFIILKWESARLTCINFILFSWTYTH